MELNANQVKELREKTGAGIMDCKRALSETAGDLDKAALWLREKGIAAAAGRAGRVASGGGAGSYFHAGGKIGGFVEGTRAAGRGAQSTRRAARGIVTRRHRAGASDLCLTGRG